MSRHNPVPVYLALVTALLGLPVPAVQAQDCQLTLSAATLDYGKFNRTTLRPAGSELALGNRRLNLNLVCSQPTDMTVLYRAVAAAPGSFRFTERGRYSVRLSEAVLDGEAVQLGQVAATGQPPTVVGSSLPWQPEQGLVPVKAGRAVAGRTFSASVVVDAWVSASAVQVRDAERWQTRGVFEAAASGASRELNMLVSLAPAACTPRLSSGGVVDLGRISATALRPDAHLALAPRTLELTVTCDDATRFALRGLDNRAGSASLADAGLNYGLGEVRGVRLGYYQLQLDNSRAQGDGQRVFPALAQDATGSRWLPWTAGSLRLGSHQWVGYASTMEPVAGPDAIRALSVPIVVQPWLAPRQGGAILDEMNIDGSSTIEIVYL